MKLLWVSAVVVLVLSKWVDGFVEHSLNETELSLMEAYGVSKANNNFLMVGLTLINGANGKGAGTLIAIVNFFFLLSSSYTFEVCLY